MMKMLLFSVCCLSVGLGSCDKIMRGPEKDRLQLVYQSDTQPLTGMALANDDTHFVNNPLWLNIHKSTVLNLDEGHGKQWLLTHGNEVRIDNHHQYAYQASESGLRVINLSSGASRQVLQDHYSTQSDPGFTFIIDGRELRHNNQPVKIDADGIALTPDGQWLYYKPLTDDKLYRIKTSYLRDETLAGSQIESYVEDLGHFACTDGMAFSKQGNLYIGDMRTNSIIRITPDHKMQTILVDDRLRWPDSYSVSHDGYLYMSSAQLDKQPDYNDGVNKRTNPYAIYKLLVE